MQNPANKRDLMAPDTEPTDEELHQVMKEALELAMERKKISDAQMKQRLLDEVAKVRARYSSLSK